MDVYFLLQQSTKAKQGKAERVIRVCWCFCSFRFECACKCICIEKQRRSTYKIVFVVNIITKDRFTGSGWCLAVYFLIFSLCDCMHVCKKNQHKQSNETLTVTHINQWYFEYTIRSNLSVKCFYLGFRHQFKSQSNVNKIFRNFSLFEFFFGLNWSLLKKRKNLISCPQITLNRMDCPNYVFFYF